MPVSFAAILRPLARRATPRLLPRLQRRSAQVVNARFFQTAVDPRIVAKYKAKLDEKLKRFDTTPSL